MSATQVHGTGIEYVTDKSDASTLCCDVLVTDKAGVGLLIKHADCQACILYDPVRHVLALIHAGWRGNVQNIYLVSVQYLRSRFGSKPRDILAAISPSLGPTAAQFTNYTAEFPKALWRFRQHAEYFDLWKLAEHQLLSAGILPQNLRIARRCTYTEPELFYSYRREGITGRLGTVAMLPLS
jgi:YfiH family protein